MLSNVANRRCHRCAPPLLTQKTRAPASGLAKTHGDVRLACVQAMGVEDFTISEPRFGSQVAPSRAATNDNSIFEADTSPPPKITLRATGWLRSYYSGSLVTPVRADLGAAPIGACAVMQKTAGMAPIANGRPLSEIVPLSGTNVPRWDLDYCSIMCNQNLT